jgi:phosphoribosylanthranilate isomerase
LAGLNLADAKAVNRYTGRLRLCVALRDGSMFRIKICGVRSPDDAVAVAEAGADAIGLNFYDKSPRYSPPQEARAIIAATPAHVVKVGVFVDAPVAEVRDTARGLGLDLVQLHGTEPPEYLAELRGLPVMKAFRIGSDFTWVGDYLAKCHQLTCVPRLVLVDAASPGQLGGTGTVVDWQALHAGRRVFAGQPLVLAGGLKPANVAAAIAAVRPWAVDVASGVEAPRCQKSPDLMREFVAAATAAFAAIGR